MLNNSAIPHVLSRPTREAQVHEEGVIKFKLTLKWAAAPTTSEVVPLEKWRAILYRLGMIGEYPKDKVGYGNLSTRSIAPKSGLVITGTQTGQRPHLKREHYTRVVNCDLGKFIVKAEGPVAPSSETLTHFAIYDSNPQIQAIFHVHHPALWEKMCNDGSDHIPEGISYGTKEMAQAAKDAIANKESGVLVMKGHQDGILAYGPNADTVGKILLKAYRDLGPMAEF